MGAKTPGVEGMNFVDRGRPRVIVQMGKKGWEPALGGWSLGAGEGGWLMKEESQRGGRVLPKGFKAKGHLA